MPELQVSPSVAIDPGLDPDNPYAKYLPQQSAAAAPSAPLIGADTGAPAVNPYAVYLPTASAATTGQMRSPDTGTSFNRMLGSTATGANDYLATTFGAPVDAATRLINAAYGNLTGGTAAPPGVSEYVTGEPSTPPLVSSPIGGSESIRNAIAGTVGRTDPRNEPERLAYAGGAGLASLLPGAAAGRALQAAGRASAVADALALPGPAGRLGGLPSAALASGGAGVGGEAGRAAAQHYFPDSPTVQALAETGGTLLGGLTFGGVAPYLGRAGYSAVEPFMPGGPARIAGRLENQQAAATAARANPLEPMIYDDAGQIGPVGARPTQAVQDQAADSLDRIRLAARGKENAAWQGVDKGAAINMPPTRQAFDNFVGGLEEARRDQIPDLYTTMLDNMQTKYGSNVPLGEMQAFRSRLLGDKRMAVGAGDNARAGTLNDLDRAMFGDVPEDSPHAIGVSGLDPVNQAAYNNAIATSRDFNTTYNQGIFKRIYGVDRSGADRVADSAVLDTLLGGKVGQQERVEAFLKATDPYEGQTLPAPRGSTAGPQIVTPQANAREWFINKILGQATTTDPATGTSTVSAKALQGAIDDNQPLISSRLFSDQQREMLPRMVNNAAASERLRAGGFAAPPVRPGALLGGPEWRSAMGISPLANLAVGTGLTAAATPLARTFGLEPSTVLLGGALLTGGSHMPGVDPILRSLYSGPIAKTSAILRGAAMNPGEQAALMAKAPAAPQPLWPNAIASALRGSTANPTASLFVPY